MFTIVMFTLVGRFALGPNAVRPYVLGMVAQYIPFMLCAGIVNCMAHERGQATLSLVYASRGNRIVIFFSRQLFHIPNGIVVVVTGLLFSKLLLGLDFNQVNWGPFITAVAVIIFSSCAAGAFIANFTVMMNDWILLYRLFAGAILVMTGVIIPITSFPAPISAFSKILPLTHGINAFRQAFDGAGFQETAGSIGAELAVGVVYMILGIILYYIVEIIAKRRGIVETTA